MWGCHPVKRGAGRSESVRSSSVDDPHSQLASEALNYLDGLYNLARWLVRDQVEAEDLVQETYLRALRHANQFRAGTNLRAWLFQILREVG
jgi:RNA polymerase sigma-70 factor, ECF subfamily